MVRLALGIKVMVFGVPLMTFLYLIVDDECKQRKRRQSVAIPVLKSIPCASAYLFNADWGIVG